MLTEYEIKILDIDIPTSQVKLEKLGAKHQGNQYFQRYVYDMNPPTYHQRVRLRTNGQQTTLTVKKIIDESRIDGVQEREVEVSDFETTNQLLEQLGYTAKAYQENRRTSYTLHGCNIEIDERPLIPPYIEIEGTDQQSVEETLALLNMPNHITTSENTTAVYRRYGIDDLEQITQLKFEEYKK